MYDYICSNFGRGAALDTSNRLGVDHKCERRTDILIANGALYYKLRSQKPVHSQHKSSITISCYLQRVF